MPARTNVIALQPNRQRLAARNHAGRQTNPQTALRPASAPANAKTTERRAAAVIRDLDQRRAFGARVPAAQPPPNELAERVAAVAGFLRKRLTGDYRVDEFGFDPHFTDALVRPLLRFFSRSWFRVEVSGIENLPDKGAALVVSNHGGVLPIDALMISTAVHDHHPAHRNLRALAADLCFDLPIIGEVARKAGHTLACPTDAHRLLAAGELAAVFPEGYKGLGECFKDRYKLRRFGRGGFVSAAVRAKAPIIPCAVVGSEEIYPMLGDVKPLARLLGLPYFPITPLFPWAGPAGLMPLPSKWHIAFGRPIGTADYDRADADDPTVMFELTDHVRETIQQMLYSQLIRRRNVFFG
ncbi:acyltransferase family protein [Mycobacterium ostraviense]|uniref:lysophospholipid acyltransferase family protein n=1 Tax=Mycobacterium ostraviense TaxID=2738409 RepID=UPI000C08994F|nr:lysophospholipid acyltransferase family protein [Mycobacterium ostraviense]UGT91708.1 acyltransferase family protein [Mycobacterium ostraviense]